MTRDSGLLFWGHPVHRLHTIELPMFATKVRLLGSTKLNTKQLVSDLMQPVGYVISDNNIFLI